MTVAHSGSVDWQQLLDLQLALPFHRRHDRELVVLAP